MMQWLALVLSALIVMQLPASTVFQEPWRTAALLFVAAPEEHLTLALNQLYSSRYTRTVVRELQSLATFTLVAVYLAHIHFTTDTAWTWAISGHDMAYLGAAVLCLARNVVNSAENGRIHEGIAVPYTAVASLLALATALIPQFCRVVVACMLCELVIGGVAVAKRSLLVKANGVQMLVLHASLTAFWVLAGTTISTASGLGPTGTKFAYYPLLFHQLLNLYCIRVVLA